MSIEANYETLCPRCRVAIEAGQLIDRLEGFGWVHTSCLPPKPKPKRSIPPPTDPGFFDDRPGEPEQVPNPPHWSDRL